MKFQIGGFLKRSLLVSIALYFGASGVRAQTWLSSPVTTDWNTSGDWDTGTVPNSTSATATFGTSSVTSLSLSAAVTLDTLLFNGTSSFGILTDGNSMVLAGSGINNVSGVQQTLINNGGNVLFENTSQAIGVLLTNAAGSTITFQDNSSVGNSTIANESVSRRGIVRKTHQAIIHYGCVGCRRTIGKCDGRVIGNVGDTR